MTKVKKTNLEWARLLDLSMENLQLPVINKLLLYNTEKMDEKKLVEIVVVVSLTNKMKITAEVWWDLFF